MITPNQFEAEKLSEIEIKDFDTVLKNLDYLHNLGPEIVVITSTFFSDNI
jgi:pyridoxal/pyridoxine/pyridoxamine kinase